VKWLESKSNVPAARMPLLLVAADLTNERKTVAPQHAHHVFGGQNRKLPAQGTVTSTSLAFFGSFKSLG